MLRSIAGEVTAPTISGAYKRRKIEGGDGTMPTDIARFVAELQPESTVLLFGAGSSIPSHAPSVDDIISHLASAFKQSAQGLNLAEFSEFIEQTTKDRAKMIAEIRKLFARVKPTGGILNLPLYKLRAIYTTNYHDIIEKAYSKAGKTFGVYTSNFDSGIKSTSIDMKLYNLHGNDFKRRE